MADPPPSSMADVAQRAGVSVSTVSRALRGSPLVSPSTTARVLQAADELDFAVSRAASSLASGRLDRIAVLLSGSLGSWFNGCLLDAIYAALHDRRQELLIYRTLSRDQRDQFFATLPARRNADALIVGSLELTQDQRQRLQNLGMPLVFVNQRQAGSVSISVDDAAGAEVAAQHLVNLGHRRIALRRVRPRPGDPAQLGKPAGRLPPGHGGGQGSGPGPAGGHRRPRGRRCGRGQPAARPRRSGRPRCWWSPTTWPCGCWPRSGRSGCGPRRTSRSSGSTTTRWPTPSG